MKIILILSAFILIAVNPAYSVEIKNKNEYLFDVRKDDGDIYLNRISLHKKFDSTGIEASFFGEAQWNMDTNQLEKLLTGVAAGKSFWKYFYASQSVQIISGEMLEYMNFATDYSSVDTTTQVAVCLPLIKKFSFYAAEEHSINLERGRGEYCESIAEIIYSPKDFYSMAIGWHHTDRIHALDTDYVSTSFMLKF